MVYFISDGEYIKIGIATNIKSRLSKLQTGNGRRLKVLILLKGYLKLERHLKEYFKSKRLVGEWFNIKKQDINKFLEEHPEIEEITAKFDLDSSKIKPVTCYYQGIEKTYKSVTEASEDTGVDHSSISKCCLGKRRTAGGYKWKYTQTNDKENQKN